MAVEDEESDADQAYFSAIEERFVRLRGTSALLSSADWQLARSWRREGIPLETVQAALELAFARHRERGGRGRISSLRYCRSLVEEAWRERLSLGSLAAPRSITPPLEVAPRLERLAALLPAGLPDRLARAGAIRSLRGEPEQVEAALARLESLWLAEANDALDAESRKGLERSIGRSLEPVRARLDSAALSAAQGRLWAQALRRLIGLPELSLFSPALEPEEPA